MTATVVTIGDLLERFEEMERLNRRWRRVGVAGLILGATAVVLAAAALLARLHMGDDVRLKVRNVVEGERFVLRDAIGGVRAEIVAEDKGDASLNMFDRDGNPRIHLRPSGLELIDSHGTQRAGLNVISGPRESDPSTVVLVLTDAAGKPRGSLTVLADGASRLFLSDRDGNGGASVQTDARGFGRFGIFDVNGRNAAWLGALPDGSRGLMLKDRANAGSLTLSVASDGGTEMLLSGATGKERAVLSLPSGGAPLFRLSGKDSHGGVGLGVTASGGSVLELVEGDGKAGTILATERGSCGLSIRDEEGKEVAALSTEGGRWPRLFLSGDGANVGSLLTVSPGGASGLSLYDKRGRRRAVLGQVSDTKAAGTSARAGDRASFSLTFMDADGQILRRVPP